MSRAEWNTTCDLINGLDSPGPGVVRSSGPCRVVPERIELATTDPITDRVAYIHFDFATPHGPSISSAGQTYTADYLGGDVIAVPSGGATKYQVLFIEEMWFHGLFSYYRAHVRFYVPPPPPLSPYPCVNNQTWTDPAGLDATARTTLPNPEGWYRSLGSPGTYQIQFDALDGQTDLLVDLYTTGPPFFDCTTLLYNMTFGPAPLYIPVLQMQSNFRSHSRVYSSSGTQFGGYHLRYFN